MQMGSGGKPICVGIDKMNGNGASPFLSCCKLQNLVQCGFLPNFTVCSLGSVFNLQPLALLKDKMPSLFGGKGKGG